MYRGYHAAKRSALQQNVCRHLTINLHRVHSHSYKGQYFCQLVLVLLLPCQFFAYCTHRTSIDSFGKFLSYWIVCSNHVNVLCPKAIVQRPQRVSLIPVSPVKDVCRSTGSLPVHTHTHIIC